MSGPGRCVACKQVRHVEGVFACLAHRAPAPRLAGDRADELRVAVPAALARYRPPALLLQRGVVGGVGPHPFELAEVGAHDRGDPGGPRCGSRNGSMPWIRAANEKKPTPATRATNRAFIGPSPRGQRSHARGGTCASPRRAG